MSLFGQIRLFAQAELIESIGKPVIGKYAASKEKIIRVYEGHIILVNPEGTFRDSIHVEGVGQMALNHDVHLVGDRIVFTKKGSGLVYELIDRKLKRVDRSLDHHFQAEALEFVRNDTLFRHGGRGFWEAHSLFTFFSFDTYEWEVVRPIKGEVLPPGLFGHHGLVSENDIFLFGGYTINPDNPTEDLFNEEVWKFNFPERRWTRLGKLNPDEILPTLSGINWKTTGSTTVMKGPARFYAMHQWLVRFDPGKNEAQFYSAMPRMAKLVPYPFLDHFIYKDHFYHYVSDNMHNPKGSEQRFIFFRVPLNKFLNQPTKVLPIYTSKRPPDWIWGVSIIPLAVLLMFLLRSHKQEQLTNQKAIITAEGLMYNSIQYSLGPVAMAVLNLLLSRDQDVPSSEIMEITSKPGLDYPNQVRLKNQVIRSLNLELRSIFRTNEELIRQTSSTVDRRIKCYCIDRNRFEKLKTL